MNYKNIDLSFVNMEEYKKKLINKNFAILGIYEDCTKNNVFLPFVNYLDRIRYEFLGLYQNYNNLDFFSIFNILTGLKDLSEINHAKVKSIVFHIISIIQSMEV